jgi:hypothetical protein
MKCLQFRAGSGTTLCFYLSLLVAVLLMSGCVKDRPDKKLKITTIATGFSEPLGLEMDKNGNIWVSDAGSGNNDGKVSVITKDGVKHDIITGFESYTLDNGEVEGPAHLMFHDGILYILGGRGKLYKADEASLKPGKSSIKASALGVEDLGAFILPYPFVNETNETHLYNLTKGPGGSIYIADAAANAIIRRDRRTGALSVVTEVPGIPNPTPVGPPRIESVPTGIHYDGQNFFVTTLLGFPFPAGKAIVYKISPSGATSVYQQGFTSLVDIAEGDHRGYLVLEHGIFGATGFAPNTGRLVWANGSTITELTGGLNLPAALLQENDHTWYVTSVGDGTVLKIHY